MLLIGSSATNNIAGTIRSNEGDGIEGRGVATSGGGVKIIRKFIET